MFPSPPQDLELAKLAFAKGDLSHATHHIACAIAVDPLGPQYLEMIDRLIANTDDPLALAPVQDGAFYGMVAVRAYMLADRGDYDDALDLLLQVVGSKPDVPFLEWFDRWTERDGVLEEIDPERFAVSCHRCVELLDNSTEDPRFAQAAMPEVVKRIGRVAAHHATSEQLCFIYSIAARRAGEVDLSLIVAQRLQDMRPSYLVSVAVAGAHRERGEYHDAIAAFRRALEFQPGDIAARLDIGDLSMDLGLPEEALAAYDEVLERSPKHPWATASRLYLEWIMEPSALSRDQLEALADDGNQRAQQLLEAGTPYVGYLPKPCEASVNAAERVIEELAECPPTGDPSEVEMELSALEAPSALVSTKRMLREAVNLDLVIRPAAIPDPDPREPWDETTYVMWRFDGAVAEPAMEPPDPAVARSISEIASTRFSIDGWKREAKRAAASIGFSNTESVLGTMLHPPGRPTPEAPEWDWMFRVQVASALVLAYIDDGWEDSIRRRALSSLLHGPVDWITTAGIIALTELAREEEDLAPWVIDRFLDLLERRPNIGYWCIEYALVKSLLRIPGVPDDLVAELRDYEFP